MLDIKLTDGRIILFKYHVNGFPTVIFVDKKGLEIDRIIGYAPPENFIPMVTDLIAGKNTIPALEKMLENNPNDFETIFKIAQKYMDRGEMEIAKPHFITIINDWYNSQKLIHAESINLNSF